jgi:hypothetical protein
MPDSSFRGLHLRALWLGHCRAALPLLAWGLVAGTLPGCSPTGSTPPAARPVAVQHDDHDDHAKHDKHEKHDDHDHDHDDHEHAHPTTLAAGVAELEAMWGHVRGALQAGERDKADDKVHAVGHLLEDFEGLLAKEEAAAQEVGKKATQEVFECFDVLDTALHGAEDDLKKIDLDKLGERLGAAIKTLTEMAKSSANTSPGNTSPGK